MTKKLIVPLIAISGLLILAGCGSPYRYDRYAYYSDGGVTVYDPYYDDYRTVHPYGFRRPADAFGYYDAYGYYHRY